MKRANGKVGPNAIIQLGESLSGRGLLAKAAMIYDRADCLLLLANPPTHMVEEQVVAQLFKATVELLDAGAAENCLSEAGERTGKYIVNNRIPRMARSVLPLLPSSLALSILLSTIKRHAWTFVGSGAFSIEDGNPKRICITHNSITTELGCIWHVAVFNALFAALLRSPVTVRELQCCSAGHDACLFEIRLA